MADGLRHHVQRERARIGQLAADPGRDDPGVDVTIATLHHQPPGAAGQRRAAEHEQRRRPEQLPHEDVDRVAALEEHVDGHLEQRGERRPRERRLRPRREPGQRQDQPGEQAADRAPHREHPARVEQPERTEVEQEPDAKLTTVPSSIDQLTESSRNAELPVRDVTGLNEGGEIPEARVVDRVEWIRAATQSMRVMTGGSEHEAAKPHFIAGRITGAQTGAVLAFISSGILGQYDPFGPNGGELLLVYPNVIAVERQLRVLPADFRLWVCLHEVTHRVQFRANPWLADHMSQALAVLTEDAGEDVGEVVGRLAELVRKQA